MNKENIKMFYAFSVKHNVAAGHSIECAQLFAMRDVANNWDLDPRTFPGYEALVNKCYPDPEPAPETVAAIRWCYDSNLPGHPRFTTAPEEAMVETAIRAVCQENRTLVLHPHFVQWVANTIFSGSITRATDYLIPISDGGAWFDVFYRLNIRC